MDPVEPGGESEVGNARPQAQGRSSISSLLIIALMLFMFMSHSGDEYLARNQYQNALESLNDQLSNFTAWMNGTTSNFTLPELNTSMEPLLSSFMSFGSHLDPTKASYYTNITGFIRGDVKFHNITPSFLSNSSADLSWKLFAENVMNGTNETEIIEKSSTWNWTASDKVAMSLVEKNTLTGQNPDFNLPEEILVVHGHIELMNTKNSEDIRLDFEGVHFVANGSIYGFAEPNGRHIDIRLLPSLVPESYQNDTARVVAPQLIAQITRLKDMIDAGIIDQDSQNTDESPKSTCPFTLYGQIDAAAVPEVLMQELEEEIQRPTGRWTIKAPKLSVRGVLISKECGILYKVDDTEGLSSQNFFRKVTKYAGLATAAYLALLVLLSRQMDRSRTPAGISRVSRWTFLTQSIVDSVSFAGHITFAILADGRPSLSLVGPAFLACVLFVYEAQFALLVHQIQAPEDAVPPPVAPAPRPAPQTPTPASTLPGLTDPTPATPAVVPAAPPPLISNLPLRSLLTSFIEHVRTDPHTRLWLTMFIFLSFVVRVIMSPSMTLLFVGSMYSLFWMPQIVRSARRGRSSGLTKEYLVGTTICRLYFALYFLGCPKNILDVEPRSWVYLLSTLMFLQVLVTVLQGHLGPAFFLPKQFVNTQTYDYHPPMPLPDSESPEQSLGDCAICMDAIVLDTSPRRRSKSVDERRDNGIANAGGSLLNAVQIGVGASGARKNYSLAPCHHLFHTECLERWLAIKNICPQCRRPLPPL